MNILICNDDGINSRGIIELASVLGDLGEVFVFAPSTERSASGSAMTLNKELILRKEKDFPVSCDAYSLQNGYPVDCAKSGIYFLQKIRGIKVDVVVSGINRGENTGIDLRYSGTVGAAFDGIEKGITSFALSLASYEYDNPRFKEAALFFKEFLSKNYLKINNSEKSKFLYNINYPDMDDVSEYVYTKPANFYYDEFYSIDDKSEDIKIMLKGSRIFEKEKNIGTDLYALEHGKVSISLLRPEFLYNDNK